MDKIKELRAYRESLLRLDLTVRAASVARILHDGQVDDDGLDYITGHVEKVAQLIGLVAPTDYVLQAAAWLHDTLEDTPAKLDHLAELFHNDVVDLVLEVTHEGSKDSKGFYFPRLETQRGIMLKFADRLSNLSRMDPWDEDRRAQYLRKSRFWRTGQEPQFRR